MLAFLVFLPLILLFALAAVYAERKVSAYIQDRYGPMEVGYRGLLQTVADILKLFLKEDVRPSGAESRMFRMAPMLIFASVFAGFAVIPLTTDILGSGIETGVFYLLAIVSLDIIGLIMAGWGSGSKYAVLGSLRAIAQVISYEIPLGLSILSAVMISQTMNLQELSVLQGIWSEETTWLFGISALGIDVSNVGGFLSWNIFRAPILIPVYVIFFIASLAECNRAPFDLPEAESELVSGYHTEYSGFRFALLFLAEYALMLLVAMLGVVLFLGGWNTVLPNIGPLKLAEWTSGAPGTLAGNLWGAFWLIIKSLGIIFLQMMSRWTYPRLRVDQLMYLCWKVLTPAALILLFISGVWRLWMV
ncbi:complex I subunit 1 family protein [Cytophagaceae bacterium ABcell3]|nr:complex I subunit 1 family protein [Cytophagaceae bacterium ABcell3]